MQRLGLSLHGTQSFGEISPHKWEQCASIIVCVSVPLVWTVMGTEVSTVCTSTEAYHIERIFNEGQKY